MTDYEYAAIEIAEEIKRARAKHAPMRGAHEGYAVLLEEVDELWDEVKRRAPDLAAMRKEAIQIGAMALAFVVEVCDRKTATTAPGSGSSTGGGAGVSREGSTVEGKSKPAANSRLPRPGKDR